MRLADVARRLQLLEDVVERLRRRIRLIEQAAHQAQAAGIWTDCVERAFERELAAAKRQIEDTRAQLRRLGEVEVDSELLEDAYRSRGVGEK